MDVIDMEKDMKKTKILSILLVLCIICSCIFALTACSDEEEGKEFDPTSAKIALLVNGTLGDKSFFDSANEGLKQIKAAYPNTTVKAIEMGNDSTKYRSFVDDACEEYDIIIMGTWQMYNHMSYATVEYPDKKFILFDYAGDFSDGKGANNLYSIEFKQNQVAFLGGVLAAQIVSDSSLALSNGSKQIGFVGGADSPIIKDFLVGFIEGVHYADPDFDPTKAANDPANANKIKVQSSFIGTFLDPTRAKDQANILYDMGCDLVFAAASQAGLGALEAAVENNKYYLACDSDQIRLFADQPAKQRHIVASVLKKVDVAIFRAFEKIVNGEMEWGTNERVGFEEDCIGFIGYNADIPQRMIDAVEEAEAKLRAGQITVTSAVGSNADMSIVDGIIYSAK